MQVIIFLGFIVMVTGCFFVLGLEPLVFMEGLSQLVHGNRQKTIRERIKEVTVRKKVKGIRKLILETKTELAITKKEDLFPVLCLSGGMLSILGFFIGYLVNNLFLIPVLSVGLALTPFWYTKIHSIKRKKQINVELETALSVVTTSYLRTDSIITAIEENIYYINPPVTDVFRYFLTQTNLINSNVKLALLNLKGMIDNEVFREWLDAMILCQEDKDLKSTLIPIVSKLSDMRIVSGELDYLLYEPMKEFITMVILLVANIPIIYFLNKDWFHTLVAHPFGKLTIAVSAIITFFSLAAVIRLTKPVEYRR